MNFEEKHFSRDRESKRTCLVVKAEHFGFLYALDVENPFEYPELLCYMSFTPVPAKIIQESYEEIKDGSVGCDRLGEFLSREILRRILNHLGASGDPFAAKFSK